MVGRAGRPDHRFLVGWAEGAGRPVGSDLRSAVEPTGKDPQHTDPRSPPPLSEGLTPRTYRDLRSLGREGSDLRSMVEGSGRAVGSDLRSAVEATGRDLQVACPRSAQPMSE